MTIDTQPSEFVDTEFKALREENEKLVKDATFWDESLFPRTRNLATAIAKQAATMLNRISENLEAATPVLTDQHKEDLKKDFANSYAKPYKTACESRDKGISLRTDLINNQSLMVSHIPM